MDVCRYLSINFQKFEDPETELPSSKQKFRATENKMITKKSDDL
jgi:hypothetical protein